MNVLKSLEKENKKLRETNHAILIANSILKDEIAKIHCKFKWHKQSEEPAPAHVIVAVYHKEDDWLKAFISTEEGQFVSVNSYWRMIDSPDELLCDEELPDNCD